MYKRQRKLSVPAHYRGKRFFLKVMAAQTVADIFIDHHFVMQHKGGYTAFVAELTDFLVPGTESVLEIRVSNAQTMDVAPICGDFNMFGGLYRGVELLVTEDVCIEPAYYASSGVFFTLVSYTHLDVYKRQYMEIVPQNISTMASNCFNFAHCHCGRTFARNFIIL